MTDYHNLSTPAEGSFNWDDDLNQNFREIDGKLVVRDVEANVTSYTPKSDALFLATDTEAIYRADGSSWNKLSSTGKNPTYDSVTTDEAAIGNIPAAYYIYDDGGTYRAIPQHQPDGVTYSEVSASDFGDVYDEVTINQIHPQGSSKEAAGLIELAGGEYITSKGELVRPSQLHLRGEYVSHYVSGGDQGRQQTKPAATIKCDASGVPLFENPNVDSDDSTFSIFENVELIGPGPADAGSIGIYGGNSNLVDWWLHKNLVIQRFEKGADIRNVDNVVTFVDSHFLECGDNGTGYFAFLNGGAMAWIRTNCWTDTDPNFGVKLQEPEAVMAYSKIVNNGTATWPFFENGATGGQLLFGNHFRFAVDGVSGGNLMNLTGSGMRVIGNYWENFSNSDIGQGVAVTGGSDQLVMGNRFTSASGSYSEAILDNSSNSGKVYAYNIGDGSEGNGVKIDGATAEVYNPGLANPTVSSGKARQNGIAGGGRLGGVDLGTTTGDYAGEVAVADGTTATNAYSVYTWDGAQWVRADGGATV